MASGQVLRKQDHLEAGKRKLEEFRRKKAAEKAKKSAATSQVQAPVGAQNENQSETDPVQLTDFNGLGISKALSEYRVGATDVSNVANKGSDISLKSDFNVSTHSKPSIPESNNETNSSVQENSHFKNEESKNAGASMGSGGFQSNNNKILNGKDDDGLSTQASPGMVNNFLPDYQTSIEKKDPLSDSSYHGFDAYTSNTAGRDLSLGTFGKSAIFTKDILPQNPVRNFWPDKLGSSNLEDNKLTFSPYQDTEDKKFSSAVDHSGGVNRFSRWMSDSRIADYDSDAQSSSNHAPPSPPAAGRRSRPSFLDSVHIPKGPSSSSSVFGAATNDSLNSKVYPMDGLASSVSHRSANSSVASGDGADTFNHVMENKNHFFSQKQNEDFAALEQHIEDLTQEKFSLQRALEASRALAESLASENSTLTDNFNQQGAVVNQLKFDLERLQEEIKAHMVELEAVKNEYANARIECNAADERAKLLASEVIGLEEKALHLRSNELKLERQLEDAQAEISSYRKKISSLERDRQDLESTINALQEEMSQRGRGSSSYKGRGGRGRIPEIISQHGKQKLIAMDLSQDAEYQAFLEFKRNQKPQSEENTSSYAKIISDDDLNSNNIGFSTNQYKEIILLLEEKDLKWKDNPWILLQRYLENSSLLTRTYKFRQFYEQILVQNGSCEIFHFTGTNKEIYNFSKMIIKRIISVEDWGISPMKDREIVINKSTQVKYNYWDYYDAFIKVLQYENDSISTHGS